MKNKAFGYLSLLLLFAGIGISFWLLQIHFQLSTGSGGLQNSCSAFGKSSGCETIALSGFSMFWIFPLAGIALAYYCSQIFLQLWALTNNQNKNEPLYISYNLATLAVVKSLGLAIISNTILKSFCVGCAALWGVNLLFWILMILRLEISWWQLFAANLESIRNKLIRLDLVRTKKIMSTTAIFFLAILGIITLVYHSEKSKLTMSDLVKATERYQSAGEVYIPETAYEGYQAKGAAAQDAVIKIVKFSDFQCPACKRAAQFFKPFYLRHKDKIRFSYKNFPLDGSCNPYAPNGGHYMACNLAMHGICAAKQGKFYEYHDMVFDRQEELTPAVLKEIMEKISLDLNAVEVCLKDPSTKEELLRDMSLGETSTIQSTPTYFINGRKIEGGFTPEQWEELYRFLTLGK